MRESYKKEREEERKVKEASFHCYCLLPISLLRFLPSSQLTKTKEGRKEKDFNSLSLSIYICLLVSVHALLCIYVGLLLAHIILGFVFISRAHTFYTQYFNSMHDDLE